MIHSQIRTAATRLRKKRFEAVRAEADLIRALQDGLKEHGAPKELCQSLGLSQAYLSDIRNWKRGIGDATVKKLCEVE